MKDLSLFFPRFKACFLLNLTLNFVWSEEIFQRKAIVVQALSLWFCFQLWVEFWFLGLFYQVNMLAFFM